MFIIKDISYGTYKILWWIIRSNSSDSDDELLLPQSPVGEVNAQRGTVETNYRISSDMTDIWLHI